MKMRLKAPFWAALVGKGDTKPKDLWVISAPRSSLRTAGALRNHPQLPALRAPRVRHRLVDVLRAQFHVLALDNADDPVVRIDGRFRDHG